MVKTKVLHRLLNGKQKLLNSGYKFLRKKNVNCRNMSSNEAILALTCNNPACDKSGMFCIRRSQAPLKRKQRKKVDTGMFNREPFERLLIRLKVRSVKTTVRI